MTINSEDTSSEDTSSEDTSSEDTSSEDTKSVSHSDVKQQICDHKRKEFLQRERKKPIKHLLHLLLLIVAGYFFILSWNLGSSFGLNVSTSSEIHPYFYKWAVLVFLLASSTLFYTSIYFIRFFPFRINRSINYTITTLFWVPQVIFALMGVLYFIINQFPQIESVEKLDDNITLYTFTHVQKYEYEKEYIDRYYFVGKFGHYKWFNMHIPNAWDSECSKIIVSRSDDEEWICTKYTHRKERNSLKVDRPYNLLEWYYSDESDSDREHIRWGNVKDSSLNVLNQMIEEHEKEK